MRLILLFTLKIIEKNKTKLKHREIEQFVKVHAVSGQSIPTDYWGFNAVSVF